MYLRKPIVLSERIIKMESNQWSKEDVGDPMQGKEGLDFPSDRAYKYEEEQTEWLAEYAVYCAEYSDSDEAPF